MTSQPATEFTIPEGLQGFWTWDKLHAPRPLTPLSDDVFCRGLTEGFCKAMDEFASPILVDIHCISYYSYLNAYPAPLGNETFEQRLARYRETLAHMVPLIGTKWQNEWLPSVLPQLEKCRGIEFSKLNDSELM